MARSILDTIVERVREDLASRKRETSIRDLEDQPYFERTPLRLAPVLRHEHLSIIAEIKRASPSQGVIRDDFNVEILARSYADAKAEAISILTEPDFFQGDLSHLEAARKTVSLPLLRKDFIVDPYQLYEARAFGADAVLLIATVLDRMQMEELMAAADELGLSCLVELYEARELDKLDMDSVEILGVNNRNLHTFEVDPDHAARVLAHVPERIVRVAESGLKLPEELARLRESGIDAVLIGESFMRAVNPGESLRELRDQARSFLARNI